MYRLFLLHILRSCAARAWLHSFYMMIRRIGCCFSCRGRCTVLWRCHVARCTSGAGRYGGFSRGIRLFAISGRRSLREYACHLLGGRLYSIRLHRSRFLRRCRIRAALLCRRAMMIAVCIRRGIDIGRIAAASARAGRRIRLRIPAAAALLTTVPADGMRRIGHQRTNDHHRHCAREAAA